jgi:hypothetical protein
MNKNWNFSERKINFQNAYACFNNPDNQSNQYDNQYFNHKASSFCNPSEYHLNKQMMLYNTPDNGPSMNVSQNSTFNNNIEKFFSPNLEKSGDKKKSKKDFYPLENQYVIYLENVISFSQRY